MTSISLDEAARRLRKTREETFTLLKSGAFAGCCDDGAFKTVDPISLDAYIRSSRHPSQRPIIPPNAETIAARAAWTEPEESAIRDAPDRYAAIAEYRLEFQNSERTDYAVGKHWYRLRCKKTEQGSNGWRRWFHRIMGWLPRRLCGEV